LRTHLNDFDLAANNGGWQWASSSGCDAQPYFPHLPPGQRRAKSFDPEGTLHPSLPARAGKAARLQPCMPPGEASPLELQEAAGVVLGRDYPLPIVDHATARERTLQRYAVVKTVER
jgi:deoxyribodipyrimidine photo-lyase